MWASIEPVWQAAISEAWAAYAAGSHAIGAIVTTPDGAIVASGRNRGRDGVATVGQLHGSRLAHAEVNAILALPGDLDPTTVTIWTTTEPCPLCIGAIAISKVRRVRFACRDPYAGSADLAGANQFMRGRAVEISGPERPDVEAVLTVMEVEFALRAGWAHDLYIAAMRAALPGPVAAAFAAHQSGSLWGLATSGASVGEAFDAIASDRLLVEGA